MKSNHTFAVLCIIRSNRSKKGKSPVYLRITVNGRRAEISTREYVDNEKWNNEKGRLRGNSEEVKSINRRLDTWETKVREHYNGFIRDEKRLSAALLKDTVLGITRREDDFLSFFEAHEKEIKSKIGIDYAIGTHKNYEASLKHLKKYISDNYKGQHITLKDLDYDFIAGFESFLKLEAKNSNNGAIKHIQRLKKVVNLAVKRGKLSSNPFSTYSVKKEKVNRQFLESVEFEKIKSIELKNPTLNKVRDIFIFICYTGLSYSDLAQLSEGNISIGIDGDQWIILERNKTGVSTNIPLLPPAAAILEKYKDHPEAVHKGILLPIMSNQKLNKYLGEIAIKCEIHKPVTCHIGRHTFATTITLSNNIPIETVSHMLGHTNLRTTQIYAKVIKKKVGEDMSKLKSLFQSKKPKTKII